MNNFWSEWEETEFSLRVRRGRVTVELDGGGLRCGGWFVPLSAARFFWLMPVKRGGRPVLQLRTSSVPVTLFRGLRGDAAELRRLAVAGNRLMARLREWKKVPASDEELRLKLKGKPEVTRLDEVEVTMPGERTPRPPGTKWQMTETPDGVMFRLGDRSQSTTVTWVVAVALVVGLMALASGMVNFWYYVICAEDIKAAQIYKHLARLIPAGVLALGFALACFMALRGYRQVAWRCRWAYFGLVNGRFISENSLWGNAREDAVAVEKCAELVVFDDDELALTGPPGARGKAGRIPTYVVQLCRGDSVAVMEVVGLTQDEARWMRDEILSRLC